MPSTYFDLSINNDGALTWLVAQPPPVPMPPEAIAFLTRMRNIFDRIGLRTPVGSMRTALSKYALDVGRIGLEVGNLAIANAELDTLEGVGINVQYFTAELDAENTLHVSAVPWTANPMPE